ncbi:2873_t:CDS:2, partial [Scutellospora calospora]
AAISEFENFVPGLENLNDGKYPPEVTPKKRTLDDPYSQCKEISKSTKYNNNDSIRTSRKSNREVNSKEPLRVLYLIGSRCFSILKPAILMVLSGLDCLNIVNILIIAKMSADVVIQHIFPKQFGLRNVFDHDSNGQPSVQSLFQFYQNRITEIQKSSADIPSYLIQVLPLIDEMISRHKKYKYRYPSLLDNYCPVMTQNGLSAPSTDNKSYIQDLNSSSNIYQITTFVRAVLRQVIPKEFWGCDDNQKTVFKAVEKFIALRFHE